VHNQWGTRCRETITGRFGRLSVSDTAEVRSLDCSQACHGSAWLEPPAEIDGVLYRPGPIPESIYLLGWLLTAAADHEGHVLMAGLGSGAGPIAMAWTFPSLRLTVAEIDPVVIGLARRHFPLLAYFESQGRIRIVAQDIVELVQASNEDHWTMACLDAYEDSTRLHCPSALLQALRGRADGIWLNVLDDGFFTATRHFADLLIAHGWTPASVMAMDDFTSDFMSGNVLLGTRPLDLVALDDFAPFAALDHRNADRAHAQLRSLIKQTRPWSALVRAQEGGGPPLATSVKNVD